MLAELDRLKVHVEGLNHLWKMVVSILRLKLKASYLDSSLQLVYFT